MKILKSFITGLFLLVYIQTMAQKVITTYYDIAETKIKEKYPINASNQKNGLYTKFDKRGIKMEETMYTNGRPNGDSKEYYVPAIGFPGDERLGKNTKWVNGGMEGICTTYDYFKDGASNLKEGKQTKILEEYFKNDNKFRAVSYFPNGNVSVDSYLNSGVTKEYYFNGNPKNINN